MANKKKTKKRLSRRMRKTIRITSAVILLLSAIGVALIPQSKKTSAADEVKVTVDDTDSSTCYSWNRKEPTPTKCI